MTIEIELKPEMAAELKTRALENGLRVSEYVQRLLEQHMPVRPNESSLSPQDRANAFQHWVENFPSRRHEPLSDDAISRESFYRGFGIGLHGAPPRLAKSTP